MHVAGAYGKRIAVTSGYWLATSCSPALFLALFREDFVGVACRDSLASERVRSYRDGGGA